MRCAVAAVRLFAAIPFALGAQPAATWSDPSAHRVRFVGVETGVQVEVLDWGGSESGRPIVLLPGLGNTAHVFDDFAPRLTAEHRVYGITRRGFGASSVPGGGYDADRLGDDVLAVLDALRIERPVLVGHSIGGTELSSIGSRFPERVAGLVYLDAGYSYAFDDGRGASAAEMQTLSGPTPLAPTDADLVGFAAIRDGYLRRNGVTFPEAEFRATSDVRDGKVIRRETPASAAIRAGARKYTRVGAPVLAIFAVPHGLGAWVDGSVDPTVRRAAYEFYAADAKLTGRQSRAFEQGLPGARVVRLDRANHYVFLSNEDEVLREMRAFIAGLGASR